MTTGLGAAIGYPVPTPLPKEWLGRKDAPPEVPSWAKVSGLSKIELRNVQAQIGYDLSQWDYSKVSASNALGRYQFSTVMLETYGLLVEGANTAYGSDCVNYRHVWQPITNTGVNDYRSYLYNIAGLYNFLSTSAAQEYLAYQYIVDLYTACTNNNAIRSDDSADIIAGMIYVAWTLGPGKAAMPSSPNGTGAWAWRYNNIGNGRDSFNGGRYAVLVLSQ